MKINPTCQVILFRLWTTIVSVSIIMASDSMRAAEPVRASVPGSRMDRLSLTPDGKILVGLQAISRIVSLWRTTDLSEINRIEFEDFPAVIACSPDGRRFVVLAHRHDKKGPPCSLYLGDVDEGRIVKSFPLRITRPWNAAFSSDGATLAICGVQSSKNDSIGAIVVLRTLDWSTELEKNIENGPVESIILFPDNDHLTYSTFEKNWELNRLTGVVTERGMTASLVRSVDGNHVARYGPNSIEIVDYDSGVIHRLPRVTRNEQKLAPGNESVTAAEFIPKTSLVAVSYRLGGVAIWDLSDYSRTRLLELGAALHPTAISASRDGKLLAIGGGIKSGEIEVWQVEDLRLNSPLKKP